MTILVENKTGILDFFEEMMPGHSGLREDFFAVLGKGDAENLQDWFLNRGFSVSREECGILIANRERVAGSAAACAWY